MWAAGGNNSQMSDLLRPGAGVRSPAPLRLLSALLAAFFLLLHLAPPAGAHSHRRRRAVLPVQVQKAAMGRMGRRVNATGTIYPLSEVKLMSRAEGQVMEACDGPRLDTDADSDRVGFD